MPTLGRHWINQNILGYFSLSCINTIVAQIIHNIFEYGDGKRQAIIKIIIG